MNNTPIVWMYKKESTGEVFFENSGDIDHGWIPLYTSPQKREPLSKDEIIKISIKCAKIKRGEELTEDVLEESEWEDLIYFVRGIEKAHGIGE
jgi:hypothetical protein